MQTLTHLWWAPNSLSNSALDAFYVPFSSVFSCACYFCCYLLLQSLNVQVRGCFVTDCCMDWCRLQKVGFVLSFKKILISRGKKLNLQTENGKRRSTCLVIMIMLSEAHWHNEGIITNYAGLCFHTFMTIRHGSGQVVADFRQSPLAGTKEFKRRWETVHPL